LRSVLGSKSSSGFFQFMGPDPRLLVLPDVVSKRQEAESVQRSTDRILTTHMGSLPRPDVLADLLVAQAEGKSRSAA
jgi:hypothetical protein